MTCGPESNLGIDVRVSLSPSACAKAGWPGPVPGQPKPAGWSVHLRNGDRAEDRKLPRAMAEVGSATAEATGVGSAWRGRHPGQRPPTDVEQPCEGCGEVRVQGPSCGLVPPGSLPEVPTCRSESRPGRPPPMVLCPLLGLPAGARVDPPGLVEECGHGLQLTSANYLTWVKVPAPKGQLPAVSPPCAFRERRGKR
jgi:hypothetical protein